MVPKLRNILNPLRVLYRVFRKRIPINPRKYWQQRHSRHVGQLGAPGCICLSEEENEANYEQKHNRLAEVLKKVFPQGTMNLSVFEIGCGTGAMFPTYKKLGMNISGVDFAPSAIEQAISFDEANVYVGDISKLQYNKAFDVVCCIDVLFHILSNKKWKSVLSGAARALKDEGVLVLQEHLINQSDYSGKNEYCHFRCLEHYERIISQCGLKLHDHVRYTLDVENTHKDILVLTTRR